MDIMRNTDNEVVAQTLVDAGINVPKGAVSFTTDMFDGEPVMVFHVNIWPDDQPCFQGEWTTVSVKIPENKLERLRSQRLLGTFGWQLDVKTAKGFQPKNG
jgi:hypothetical protein